MLGTHIPLLTLIQQVHQVLLTQPMPSAPVESRAMKQGGMSEQDPWKPFAFLPPSKIASVASHTRTFPSSAKANRQPLTTWRDLPQRGTGCNSCPFFMHCSDQSHSSKLSSSHHWTDWMFLLSLGDSQCSRMLLAKAPHFEENGRQICASSCYKWALGMVQTPIQLRTAAERRDLGPMSVIGSHCSPPLDDVP